MSADANRIVQKLWSYCNVLRDDGLSYGDYLEQLTYLLFLKMAKETKTEGQLPEAYRWDALLAKKGVDVWPGLTIDARARVTSPFSSRWMFSFS